MTLSSALWRNCFLLLSRPTYNIYIYTYAIPSNNTHCALGYSRYQGYVLSLISVLCVWCEVDGWLVLLFPTYAMKYSLLCKAVSSITSNVHIMALARYTHPETSFFPLLLVSTH